MRTVFALLCFVVVIHWLIFPYPSGFLHWHCGNLTIAPVPAKQPRWIWISISRGFIMNDCITTTKQSTTKPCAYFLGYTVDRNVLADVILMQRNPDPIALMMSTEAEVGNHNSVCKCFDYMYAIVKLSGPYHCLNLIQEWISNYIYYKIWDEITHPPQTSTAEPLKFGNEYVISPHTLMGTRLLVHFHHMVCAEQLDPNKWDFERFTFNLESV